MRILAGLIAASALACAACIHTAPRTTASDAAFAFRFEITTCMYQTLDTSTGRYMRSGKQARVVLPPSEMSEVAQALQDINFFELPPQFIGTPDPARRFTFTDYTEHFRLEAWDHGTTHAVAWDDRSEGESEQAAAVGRVGTMIYRFMMEQPGAKRLSQYQCGYL